MNFVINPSLIVHFTNALDVFFHVRAGYAKSQITFRCAATRWSVTRFSVPRSPAAGGIKRRWANSPTSPTAGPVAGHAAGLAASPAAGPVQRATRSPSMTDSLRGQLVAVFPDHILLSWHQDRSRIFPRSRHRQITAFVPQHRRQATTANNPVEVKGRHILEQLAADGYVVFTPSRRVGTRNITPDANR